MLSNRSIFFTVTVYCVFVFECVSAYAHMNSMPYRPSPFADRLLTVDTARQTPPGQFLLGLELDFSRRAFVRTPTGAAAQSIVDELAIAHFQAAIAPTKWFSAGIVVPVALAEHYIDAVSRLSTTVTTLGDTLLAGKFIIRSDTTAPIGIALTPFVGIPTGSDTYFTSTGGLSGGIRVTASHAGRILDESVTLGYTLEPARTLFGTNLDDRLTYGAGLRWHPHARWDLLAEISGSTVARQAFRNTSQSPLEADLGIRHRFAHGWSVTTSGGLGLLHGNGTPQYRITTGITYQHHR